MEEGESDWKLDLIGSGEEEEAPLRGKRRRRQLLALGGWRLERKVSDWKVQGGEGKGGVDAH
jgi:hypothetical protein